jgi:hypothetical protein
MKAYGHGKDKEAGDRSQEPEFRRKITAEAQRSQREPNEKI